MKKTLACLLLVGAIGFTSALSASAAFNPSPRLSDEDGVPVVKTLSAPKLSDEDSIPAVKTLSAPSLSDED